jgi:hypothetical protein
MAAYNNFGQRAHAFNCPHFMLEGLSKDEIKALHAYKVAFSKEFEALYKHMDPKAADDFIRPLLKRLSE